MKADPSTELKGGEGWAMAVAMLGQDEVELVSYQDWDPGQLAHPPFGNSEQGACKIHRPNGNDPY